MCTLNVPKLLFESCHLDVVFCGDVQGTRVVVRVTCGVIEGKGKLYGTVAVAVAVAKQNKGKVTEKNNRKRQTKKESHNKQKISNKDFDLYLVSFDLHLGCPTETHSAPRSSP